MLVATSNVARARNLYKRTKRSHAIRGIVGYLEAGGRHPALHCQQQRLYLLKGFITTGASTT